MLFKGFKGIIKMAVKQLNVYDVGFGDCSLLELESFNLLVDCGGNRNKKQVKDDIFITNSGKRLECVITHFHSDHYNILSQFGRDSLDAIYAPNFFTKDEIKIQLYSLLLLSSTSSSYLMAESMLKLIPNLLDYGIIKRNRLVNFVKKGDYIGEKNLQVLWPNVCPNQIGKLANDIKCLVEKSTQHSSSDISEGFSNVLIPTMEELAISYYNIVQRHEEINAHNLREISSQINLILKEVSNLKNNYNNVLRNIKGLPKKRIKQIQNQYSIVFHNYDANCINGKNLLFLGDVTPDVFEKYINVDVNKNCYDYIKVSHHGTKKYFMRDLPHCETMIISNGKKSKCDITAMYPLRYSQRKFVCTNNKYCEYYNAKTNFGKNNIKLPCQKVCDFKNYKVILT